MEKMGIKKGFDYDGVMLIDTYGWPIILCLFLVFGGLWTWGTMNNQFNPEEHVCLEYDCKCATEEGTVTQKGDCLEWREKTFCEKCVDDWTYTEVVCNDPIGLFSIHCQNKGTKTCDSECICEEWEQWEQKQDVASVNCKCETIGNPSRNPIVKCVTEIKICEDCSEPRCFKAREKNKCDTTHLCKHVVNVD